MLTYNKFNDSLQDKIDLYIDEYQARENVDLLQFLETVTSDDLFDENEILLRLCKSIINSWTVKTKHHLHQNLYDIACTLFEVFSDFSANDEAFVRQLLTMLEDKYLDESSVVTSSSIQHRNVCLVLNITLERYPQLYANACPSSAISRVVHYLMTIIRRCQQDTHTLQTVLYALWAIEKFPLLISQCSVPILEGVEQRMRLRMQQQKSGGKSAESQSCLSSLYDAHHYSSDSSSLLHYQVGFCAQWLAAQCREQEFWQQRQQQQQVHYLMPVKLSPDRLSARVDQLRFPTVRSAFPICTVDAADTDDDDGGGVYYYEVVLLTTGRMRIGWTTRQAVFSEWKAIGDDQYSIGLDTTQGCLFHSGRCYPVKKSPIWRFGDVIGCQINIPKRKFSFYHNGKRIAAVNSGRGSSGKFYFSAEPYFAAASLSAHQHIDFNFGQSSFQYNPEDCLLNKNRYHSGNNYSWPHRLVGPTLNGTNLDDGTYWYKEEITKNHVNLLFTDKRQLEMDVWVDRLLQFVLATPSSTRYIQNDSKQALQSLLQNSDNATLRIAQSTIERIGADVPDEVFPSLIYLLTYFLSLINSDKLPNPSKLAELLYPYTRLSTDWHYNKGGKEGVTAKHRNTCLTLAIFTELYEPAQRTAIAMNEELVQYLKSTILHSRCKSQQCFATICLQNLTVVSLKSTLIPKLG